MRPVTRKLTGVRIDTNTAGAQPAPRSETELTMSRPMNPLRAAAVALASLSLVLAACGASATPGLTFSPVAVVPTAAPSVAPSAPVVTGGTIALSEWKVDMASAIKAGKSTFSISNAGTIPHELLIFKSSLAPSAYPTDPAGDIVEDGGGVDLVSDGENVDPAGTQTRSIDLAPGTYLFVCNIPGHFKAGMFTVVTVTP
jgi:uncharacterized cupredoxin-like copper-binding protein